MDNIISMSFGATSTNDRARKRRPAVLLRRRFQHREGLAPFSIEIKQHAVSRIGFSSALRETRHVSHGLAVDFRNHVFALECPCARRQAVVRDVSHDHALVDSEIKAFGNFLGQLLHLQAELAGIFRLSAGCGSISFEAREISPGNTPILTGIFSVCPFRQTVRSTF